MGAEVSSVFTAGGAVWVASVGVAPVPSGGGVGRVRVDIVIVNIEQDVV